MSKKRSLGRGLGAILEEVEKAYENNLNDNSDIVQELDIHSISPNPYQPRKSFDQESLDELAHSIEQHGLIQPIIVYEDGDAYVLIAGERRLRACKIAGFKYIKSIVADVKVEKLREYALIENIQREDLNPIDLANSYKELLEEHNLTHDELSKRISKSRSQITNSLRILQLSDDTKSLLLSAKISQGHAKVLVGLDENLQKVVTDSIIGQRLSVREAENLIKKIKDGDKKVKDDKTEGIKLNTEPLSQISSKLKEGNIKSRVSNNSFTVYFSDQEDIQKLINIIKS